MRLEQLELPFATRFKPPVDGGLDCGPDSLTHQECAKDCDINYIMKRYAVTGVMPNAGLVPQDGALQELLGTDFAAIQNRMIQAREEFDALPSALRDRFSNDPAKLLKFLGNPDNRKEAIALGLIAETPPKGGEGSPPQRGEGESGTSPEPVNKSS